MENIGENTMIIMCMLLQYHLLENPCGEKQDDITTYVDITSLKTLYEKPLK
jgi:hypothetical protein